MKFVLLKASDERALYINVEKIQAICERQDITQNLRWTQISVGGEAIETELPIEEILDRLKKLADSYTPV